MATTTEETTGLLSLPLELLEQIADLAGGTVCAYNLKSPCCESSVHEGMVAGPLLTRPRLRTICALRLVSKRMYDAASHVLLPILRVEISQKSLLRAERLLSIPQIAHGVYSVQVFAAYCHDDAVSSWEVFAATKEVKMDTWEEAYMEAYNPDYSGGNINLEKLRAIHGYLVAFRNACSEIWMDKNIADSKLPIHRAMLQEAFEIFQAQYREQQQLIMTGQFATRLASLVAPLPGLRSLCIEDADTSNNMTDRQLIQVFETNSNRNIMFDMMKEPMSWTECWANVESDVEGQSTAVIAAALLCDIPIALHRAGAKLQQMHIRCLPPKNSLKFLQPQNCFLKGTTAELRQTFGFLSKFNLTLDHNWRTRIPFDLDNYRCVTNYLQLCTSGEHLQNVHLHLDPMSLGQSHWTQPRLDFRDVLSAMTTTRLRRVCISSALISHANMVSICERMGSHTTLCFLSKLRLVDAGWKETAKMIFGVLGPRIEQNRCSFQIRQNSSSVPSYYRENASNLFTLFGPKMKYDSLATTPLLQ